VGLHRPAEFNRSHIPAYVSREDPKGWLCVYPFVRSLEWYLLPEYERRGMLAEHGIMGRDFPDVRANTVSAFGLGDYEWLLAFEADRLERIVDCIRHLRASRARVHTKLEVPFFTGSRCSCSSAGRSGRGRRRRRARGARRSARTAPRCAP